jgi:hypothetical protein
MLPLRRSFVRKLTTTSGSRPRPACPSEDPSPDPSKDGWAPTSVEIAKVTSLCRIFEKRHKATSTSSLLRVHRYLSHSDRRGIPRRCGDRQSLGRTGSVGADGLISTAARHASRLSRTSAALLLAGAGLIFMTYMRFSLPELGWIAFAPLLVFLRDRPTLSHREIIVIMRLMGR